MASFKSFLSAVGHFPKVVFSFLGSTKGQQVVTSLEGGANAVLAIENPALLIAAQGIEGLINAGIKNAAAVEALSVAAGQQSGTGAQKAAAVTSILAGDAGAFLKSIRVNDATDAEVQALASVIGTASADILNAIPARAMTVTAAGPGPVVPPPPPPAA